MTKKYSQFTLKSPPVVADIVVGLDSDAVPTNQKNIGIPLTDFALLGVNNPTGDLTLGTGKIVIGTGIDLQSGLFSRSGTADITASTTQTQGQSPLTNEINEIGTVANTNDVVTMPSAVEFVQVFIVNKGANSLQIFPASGDDLEDGVDVSINLGVNSKITLFAINTTNWVIE